MICLRLGLDEVLCSRQPAGLAVHYDFLGSVLHDYDLLYVYMCAWGGAWFGGMRLG